MSDQNINPVGFHVGGVHGMDSPPRELVNSFSSIHKLQSDQDLMLDDKQG